MSSPISFDDLPGWLFEVDEVSAGTFIVQVSDSSGVRVELRGIDPEKLLTRCRDEVVRIMFDSNESDPS